MANNEYYIELVLKKFKNGNDEVDAIIFLQENGFDTEEHKEIIEAATARWQKEKLPFLAKKRKFAFALWGALTALMFYTDFFLLPNLVLTGYKFVLCLVGTLALLFCFYLSMIYYKSWTTSFLEKYSNFKVSFQTFPLFLVLGVIPFFVMSWRFDVAADKSLSMDMIKAKGIITGGYSLKARRGDIASEVTVQFKTRDGVDIITTENISSYAFKNFHEGQEVDLIYSKKNPRNIDLLISGDDTKDITRSEERDITPADLIALTTMEPPKIEASLDKICYGWEMDQTDSSWTNIKRNMTLKIKPEGLIMVTDFKTAYLFSRSLAKQGYKPAISNPKQPYSTEIRTFENESYMFMVQLKNIQNNLLSVIKVVKK